MFSPDASTLSIHGGSGRNPRRRQRNSEGDSIRQQPQRKRSKLVDESFISPGSAKLNGNGHAVNGHANNRERQSMHSLDIPVREKKRTASGQRGTKTDGQITLTKNPNYMVSQLPSFPDRLRNNPSEAFRAFVLPSTPYALALTHEHALVWDYTALTPNPVPYTLKLPHPSKKNEPLPVGSIVKSGSSSEIGLVVVAPTSGKIVYWDNVDSAETLGLFQQKRHSVEGSVGGMLSGETITEVVDAEHAGFMVVFSSGRLAQLTLRDTQGRPHINVLFLRNGGAGNGGLFGGLKSVFSGNAWKRAIAAVRTRQSESKGHMEIITATKLGLFQFWDLSWAGQHIFKGEIDISSELSTNLIAGSGPEQRKQPEDIRLLDFSVIPHKGSGKEISPVNAAAPMRILMLVSIARPTESSYALVEVDFVGEVITVSRVIPLDSYEKPTEPKDPSIAKLLVPQPGHTAFVIFKGAVVVASLAERSESPDAQLMSEAGEPETFQDTFYFRKDRDLELVGYAPEYLNRKDHQSSCVVFVRGYGVIRVGAVPPTDDEAAVERHRVTARSRIEQGVFFGTQPDNILDFSVHDRSMFMQNEVEDAAIAISHEILTTNNQYLSNLGSTTEQHLFLRAKALRDLMTHLRTYYPTLSRMTRFSLLWNAEKMAAARGIWRHYDARMQLENIGQKDLMSELVELLSERYKTGLRKDLGETDPVRQWFMKDVDRIQIIVPWAYNAIKELYHEGIRDHASLIQLISEADDIMLGALKSALEFRQENIANYGLQNEDIKDGILVSGYENLPEIWTSTYNTVASIRQLIDLARELACQYFQEVGEAGSIGRISKKVATDNPKLVELCCLIHMERYRRLLASDAEATRASGRALKSEFENKVRAQLLTKLSLLGMGYEGMKVAEKFHDMSTLCELVVEEASYLITELSELEPGSTEASVCEESLAAINERIQGYFRKFGDDWANAFYSSHIYNHRIATLFQKEFTTPDSLTKFLRADPYRAKLSWINDVTSEKDYGNAAKSLARVGLEKETNIWCKKVELSLAKLAVLAAEEGKKTKLKGESATLMAKANKDLKLVALQNQLLTHILPFILEAAYDEAKVELLMQRFGAHLEDRPALSQLLQQGFEELCDYRVMEPEMLIDVLTLMDHSISDDEPISELTGTEFWVALQVLDTVWSDLDDTTRSSLLKLIWKRLFIADDWEAINNTRGKSDEALSAQMRNTALFRALKESARATGQFTKQTNIPPLSPSETLGAGCDTKELAKRFPSEDLRDPIARDNESDEETLERFISNAQLGVWYVSCKAVAIATLQEEAEEIAEDARWVQEGKGEDEDAADVKEVDADGVMSEVAGSVRGSAFDGDDEGSEDVEMDG